MSNNEKESIKPKKVITDPDEEPKVIRHQCDDARQCRPRLVVCNGQYRHEHPYENDKGNEERECHRFESHGLVGIDHHLVAHAELCRSRIIHVHHLFLLVRHLALRCHLARSTCGHLYDLHMYALVVDGLDDSFVFDPVHIRYRQPNGFCNL